MPFIVQQGSEEWSRRTAGLRVSPFVALVSCNHLLCEHRRRGRRFFDCIHEDELETKRDNSKRTTVRKGHSCLRCRSSRVLVLWNEMFCGPPFSIVYSLYLAAGGKTVQDCFLRCLNRGFRYIFGRRSIRRGSVRSRCLWRIMVIVDDASSVCAILFDAYMRVWPSGKAKASQAFIRGFESRHPLHFN